MAALYGESLPRQGEPFSFLVAAARFDDAEEYANDKAAQEDVGDLQDRYPILFRYWGLPKIERARNASAVAKFAGDRQAFADLEAEARAAGMVR